MAKVKGKEQVDGMAAVLANIEKSMGNKGAKSKFARFGDIDHTDQPVISFGIKDVDAASYCGGVPRGKMVELFGPESSGKSLLCTYLMAQAQKQGLEAALIDVEQSFDQSWSSKHGLDCKRLVYSNDFDSGENALEYAYQLAKSGAFGIVVIDSTAALIPKSELDGSLEDNARMGALAQMLSRACRKIMDVCGKTNTTVIFINQIREKLGVTYGSNEITPGGRALKFYSHQRIRVAKKTKIKVTQSGEDVVVGQISSVTFVKNKTARPFGECEFKIIFDQASMNPVVMLCNALKDAKMIGSYKGVFRIKKDVLGDDHIVTGATTILELANYLVNEDIVLKLLEKLEEEIDDTVNLDDAILEMKSDSSKIVAPDNSVIVDAKKTADADPSSLGDDAKEEVEPSEE